MPPQGRQGSRHTFDHFGTTIPLSKNLFGTCSTPSVRWIHQAGLNDIDVLLELFQRAPLHMQQNITVPAGP